MKIAILYKGRSPEREVSYKSGVAINRALQKLSYETLLLNPADYSYAGLVQKIKDFQAELVFFGLHGGEGENGQLQALLELEQISFTGSCSKACAVAMDKYLCEKLVCAYQIPVAKGKLLFAGKSSKELDFFPMVVKPNDAGSSVGISLVSCKDGLASALQNAFACSSEVICQEFISGREITVPILDDKPLPVIEIKPKKRFFDYENKYTKGNTEYIVPAVLDKELTKKVQDLALLAHRAVGAEVYSRVDFRFDGKNFFFLEINTLPGMTATSLVPMAAEESGLSFEQLIAKIVNLSLKKRG